jgi:hypothetical protein
MRMKELQEELNLLKSLNYKITNYDNRIFKIVRPKKI